MDKAKTPEKSATAPQTAPQTAQQNEGEGNKTAARHYNDATEAYVKAGKVDKAAAAAEKAIDGPEAEKLRKAEAEGKARGADRK